jgi:cytochrome c2
VKAESGEIDATDQEKQALQVALRMKIEDNEGNKDGQKYGEVVKNCMECHDLDNSPDFDFQKYWPQIKHVGKD